MEDDKSSFVVFPGAQLKDACNIIPSANLLYKVILFVGGHDLFSKSPSLDKT